MPRTIPTSSWRRRLSRNAVETACAAFACAFAIGMVFPAEYAAFGRLIVDVIAGWMQ